MLPVLSRLEVRNYRSFTDESPLVIPLDPTVVAFVGPNNIGKTAALRMIYELRPVWQMSIPAEIVSKLSAQSGIPNGNFNSVKDNAEVFSNSNERPMLIDWIFAGHDDTESYGSISKIRLEVERNLTVTYRIYGGRGQQFQDNTALTLEVSSLTLVETSSNKRLANASKLQTISSRFAGARFLPAIRTASHNANGVAFDIPLGVALATQWNTLKTGDDKKNCAKITRVEKLIKSLFGFRDLQINVNQSSQFSILIEGHTYRLDEVGNGLAQFLYAITELVVRPAPMVLIDEPETALHPSLQRDLLETIAELSGGHVFFATHSLGLARSFADAIIGLHRVNGTLEVKPIRELSNYAELLGELSFSSWGEIGFDAVLLVEGATELRSIPILLRSLNIEHRVMLMPLGGSLLIDGPEQDLAEYQRLNKPVFVLIDSEKAKDSEPLSEKRTQFLASCEKFRYTAKALDRRALENYVTADAAQKVTGLQSANALGPFDSLKKLCKSGWPWSKFDVPAIFQAMPWCAIESTDLGKFLLQIKEKVTSRDAV